MLKESENYETLLDNQDSHLNEVYLMHVTLTKSAQSMVLVISVNNCLHEQKILLKMPSLDHSANTLPVHQGMLPG